MLGGLFTYFNLVLLQDESELGDDTRLAENSLPEPPKQAVAGAGFVLA